MLEYKQNPATVFNRHLVSPATSHSQPGAQELDESRATEVNVLILLRVWACNRCQFNTEKRTYRISVAPTDESAILEAPAGWHCFEKIIDRGIASRTR